MGIGIFQPSYEKTAKRIKAVANLLRSRQAYTSEDIKQMIKQLKMCANDLERLGK